VRILILTPSRKRTGPVLGAVLWAKHLQMAGFRTTLGCLDGEVGEPREMVVQTGSEELRYHNFNMTGWHGLRHFKRLKRYVHEMGFELVISFGLRPDIVNSLLENVVRLSSARENLKEQYAASYGLAISHLLAKIHFAATKKLDGIIVLTKAMGELCLRNGVKPSAIHLVRNFIDVRALQEGTKIDKYLEDGLIHIGFFGLIIRRKRVDIALTAIKDLVFTYGHKKVVFHVVGDGPLLTQMIAMASDLGIYNNTRFHGYVGEPFGLMRQMNMLVLPSASEGLPRCLMEGLALGKTCIATDLPGMSELIQHGKTGYLFPQNNSQALAALLNRVIKERAYIESEGVKRYMLQNFDVSCCIPTLIGKIIKVVDKANEVKYGAN